MFPSFFERILFILCNSSHQIHQIEIGCCLKELRLWHNCIIRTYDIIAKSISSKSQIKYSEERGWEYKNVIHLKDVLHLD